MSRLPAPEGATWRPGWSLAPLLTLGLLGWELLLQQVLSGGYGARWETVGARLAADAAVLLPVWLGVVGALRGLLRRDREPRTDGEKAALLAVSFLLVMPPVAIGRGVLQRSFPSAAPTAEGARSAEPTGEDGRFLCAVSSSDLSEPTEDAGEALWSAVGAGAQEALLLQVPVLPLALLLVRRRPQRTLIRELRPASTVPVVVLGAVCLMRSQGRVSGEGEPLATGLCRPGAPVRTYAVAAVATRFLLNVHGEYVPEGFRYVLDEEGMPSGEPPLPLVLRASLGECLHLRFTNRLADTSAALHVEGLGVTARDGASGDFVPSAAVAPGDTRSFVLALPESPAAEGAYLLHDPGDGGSREARGLFGALVLEPAGSRYRDASTGLPLSSGQGWEALVHPPSGPAFRELVLLAHALGPPEVADVRSARGEPLPVLDEMAGPFRPGAYGLNYRSLPEFEREEPPDEDVEPNPWRQALAAPLLRSYRDEPVRLRVVHAGSAEPHIPHVHGKDDAPHLLMPGGRLTLASPPGGRAAGDVLVHCHVPNHSSGGERVTWRVYSHLEPGLAPLTAPEEP